MSKKTRFSQQDIDKVKEAVSKAEEKTSGEIVPYFVEKSDEYDLANLRGALILGSTALGTIALLSNKWQLLTVITPIDIIAFTVAFGFIGFLIPRVISPTKRFLVSESFMRERVKQKAMQAFLTEEIFHTEKRTGILIFVSHLEHMVEVIGDEGINKKVEKAQWQSVVDGITASIKNDNLLQGIIKGIEDCGEILRNAKVDKAPDNPNELPDNLRMK